MARKREYTGKDIYTVEEIKDKKIEKKTTYYLIKWKNYSDKHNSWEPEENVSEALIAGYESCSKPGPKTSSDEKGEQEAPPEAKKMKLKQQNDACQLPEPVTHEKPKGVKKRPVQVVGATQTGEGIKYLIRFTDGSAQLLDQQVTKNKYADLLITFFENNLIWN